MRVPKRGASITMDKPEREIFFGLYAREGISFIHFFAWMCVCDIPRFIFNFIWIYCLGHLGDIQDGFRFLNLSATFTAAFLASLFMNSLYPDQ